MGGNQTDHTPLDVSGPIYYVGIGASAGGLEALESFFKNMPEDSGMAFIVIQHLSPDYKSMMVELLSKYTKMNVLRADEGMQVEPNTIYLIPPRKNLRIFHGKLMLSEQDFSRGVNLPIDIFLQSLAEDQAEKAIGIILSGTGSDGMRGIRLIKQNGGIVFVQSIESSRFDGMPRSAISTGLADFILAPEEMPAYLLNLQKRPELPSSQTIDAISHRSLGLDHLFAIVREATKVDFTYYKPSTILRRIERRMTIHQIANLEDYIAFLEKKPAEVEALYREFLIGVTSFFRDREVFEELEKKYLPELFADKRELRLWIAGCSTGEEVYSFAILCKEVMEKLGKRIPVKIFATDIDREALMVGGLGQYPENIAADVPARFLTKYFHFIEGRYQIDRSLREMVVFAQHNLIKDPPFTNLDLISCRNLLIYLQPPLQEKAISLFNFSLKPNGLLVLGTSESVAGADDLFEPLSIRYKIYKTRGTRRPVTIHKLADTGLFQVPTPQGLSSSVRQTYLSTDQQERIFERFLNAIASDFLPTTIFVNQRMEVLHILGDASAYFRIPTGKMTNDITRLAVKDLSVPLATGIQKAFKTQTATYYNNVSIKIDNQRVPLDLIFLPIEAKRNQEPVVAIMLRHKEGRLANTEHSPNFIGLSLSDAAEQRIRDLENELQFTRENLQATIEELETSNEELQATNEELMASNQELQSANEELQSVNEELHTVNTEYQNKIIELTELNNDLNNLIEATQPITLFFDDKLELRRFTPEARKVFQPNQLKIGQPIASLVHPLQDVSLEAIAQHTQQTEQSFQKEVRSTSGKIYLLKAAPYCIEKNICLGVVIAIDDISSLRNAQEALASREADLAALYEAAPIGIAVLEDKRINRASQHLCKISEYSNDELEGKPIQSLFELSAAEIGKNLKTNDVTIAIETNLITKTGNLLPVLLKLTPLLNTSGKQRHLLTVVDISSLKKAEKEANDNQKRYSLLFNSMMEGVVFQDTNGRITAANPAAERILGLTLDQMMGRTSMDERWQATDQNGNSLSGDQHPSMVSLRSGKPVQNFIMRVFNPQLNQHRFIKVNAVPLIEQGQVVEVYTTFEDITDEVNKDRL